jgi:nitrogen fixation/metabolism regulation signal transduction histidine kinase
MMPIRSTRWIGLMVLSATLAAALALIFLLTIATQNLARYERHFDWLLTINISVAAILGLAVVVTGVRLIKRVRNGLFGSRLLLKLAATFALVGAVPGTLIYLVSYQFVSRSIESWFDVEIEQALESGLSLGRTSLQVLSSGLANKTRIAAEHMAEVPNSPQLVSLERLREQLGAYNVLILSDNGQVLASAHSSIEDHFLPTRPTPSMMRQARSLRVHTVIEGLEEHDPDSSGAQPAPVNARIQALAWIPANTFALDGHERYLQVTQQIPIELATNALAVASAYKEYQQRMLGRLGLRKMYIGTLTLTLILALFCALLMAAALGQQLARPLLLLAEGVNQVAQGDLRPKAVFASRDELGGLTRSFALMTAQLDDARTQLHTSLTELENARTHLQTILDNLTAGVIVFDLDGHMDTVNPGALRILRAPPWPAWRGQRLDQIPGLAGLAKAIEQRFTAHAHAHEPNSADPDHWQDSLELQAHADHDVLTLLVRGASLPSKTRLIVFDDISDVVSAQRSVAWAEVARRLAHEIKNPLTPIQLSAERIQHKLENRLEGTDRQLLVKSVATIVAQVQSMKQLVNEFRDYSRLPSANLGPLDLNELVAEVLALYGNALETGLLRADTTPDLPSIQGDTTQLRQVIHNLVQNALDAVAQRTDGRVMVRTEVVNDEHGEVRSVRLKVIDNGPGFTDKVLKRAFEPYVTTKPKGTGLGLAVVKKIAEEHGARVRIQNLGDEIGTFGGEFTGNGAQVSITFVRSVLGAPASKETSPPNPATMITGPRAS